MTVPFRLAALGATAGVALAASTAAEAATKTVDMGAPARYQRTLQGSQLEVNDYFPHAVSIAVGDSVRFRPAGFHTVDIPPRGDEALPLLTPTGQKVSAVNDAAGAPFWFNGQDQVGFNPVLLRSTFGKRLTYRGSNRVESGLPLAERPRPVTVRFTRAGTYDYYCDVHPGMEGTVRVLASPARVPSSRRDAAAVRTQVNTALKAGRALANANPPAGTVWTGGSARGGVEYFGMLPASTTVRAGTTLRFAMSPRSYDVHTATFGPGNPENEPNSYLGQIAATFQGQPDPRGVYPSEAPGTPATLTSALHGNGFWNSGVMDRARDTPLPGFNAVTFGAPGTYEFYCVIHPFMHGTVVVQ